MHVANARAIFILSDSAFIFITGIDMAKWIFQQFLQTHYVLFGDQYVALYTRRWRGCCCMKRVLLRPFGGADSALDYQLK